MICIEFMLTSNFFLFDDSFYLQLCDASLGAKFSPSLANLFMGWWEQCVIFSHNNPLFSIFFGIACFIDDLMIIWDTQGTAFDLNILLDYVNRTSLNLKFTASSDPFSINYLTAHYKVILKLLKS